MSNETKIQTETTKIQSAKTPEVETLVTVEDAVKTKEVDPKLKPKFIPTSYQKQDLGNAKEQEDGTVVREIKLSEPVVPDGEEVDPRYLKQTQVVTYKDNKRIGCKILDADDKEITQLNTAMLDG
jgi:hypothetical protein